MKSYRALAIKELFAQRVTSVLVLIAVILSTMMTTIVGQSLGVLTAMREQQAIALGGNRYATFLQMDADQLHALQQDERLSYSSFPNPIFIIMWIYGLPIKAHFNPLLMTSTGNSKSTNWTPVTIWSI